MSLECTFLPSVWTRKFTIASLWRLVKVERYKAERVFCQLKSVNRPFSNLQLPLTTITYSICTVLASVWSWIFLNANAVLHYLQLCVLFEVWLLALSSKYLMGLPVAIQSKNGAVFPLVSPVRELHSCARLLILRLITSPVQIGRASCRERV